LLVKQGRTNEALAEAKTALNLDPVTPTTRQHYVMTLIAAGRTGEAINEARIIEKLEPEFQLVNYCLFVAYLRRAEYDSAIAAGKRFRVKFNVPWVWGELGYAYAVSGQKAQALELLEDLKRDPTSSPTDFAHIQAGLGMKQEALANLELGYLTPPIGMNLFLASYRFNKPVIEICRSALPFLLVLLLLVLLITYVPELTLAFVK